MEGQKRITKTVIFELVNKKDGHIICFKNLAFRINFYLIDKSWFIALNPTWSFTNPGGYKTSRFESSYLSGLKRFENNGSIYNYFRFLGYHLSHENLFTKEYPYLNITSPCNIKYYSGIG